MKSFVVILLLVIFFLTGMLFGIDRGSISEKDELGAVVTESYDISSKEKQKNASSQKKAVEQMDSLATMEVQGQEHFTQKTASILESGVKGFYEIVVDLLYHIAQLFF